MWWVQRVSIETSEKHDSMRYWAAAAGLWRTPRATVLEFVAVDVAFSVYLGWARARGSGRADAGRLGFGRIVASEMRHRLCSGMWYEVDER